MYKSLKATWNLICGSFLCKNPSRTISRYYFCELFTKAYLQAANIKFAIKGFQSCGIVPFNHNVLSKDTFAPSKTIDINADLLPNSVIVNKASPHVVKTIILPHCRISKFVAICKQTRKLVCCPLLRLTCDNNVAPNSSKTFDFVNATITSYNTSDS